MFEATATATQPRQKRAMRSPMQKIKDDLWHEADKLDTKRTALQFQVDQLTKQIDKINEAIALLGEE